MAVLTSARDDGAAICFILKCQIGAALFTIARHPVAFEIAEMRIGRLARHRAHSRAARSTLRVELDHLRLHQHPT
jgi:hypothetical protein